MLIYGRKCVRSRGVKDTTQAVVLLTPHAVAQLLHVSERTLQNWRRAGHGPQWIKVGPGLVRYDQAALDDWLAQNRRGGAEASA